MCERHWSGQQTHIVSPKCQHSFFVKRLFKLGQHANNRIVGYQLFFVLSQAE